MSEMKLAKSAKSFYLTTTLPYVNADPHVGFAMEIIRADVVARYLRKAGDEVFFNTGTDEHGAKIYENAIKAGQEPQEYVDEYAEKFRQLLSALNISDINFIRTTDAKHVKAAEELWRRCKVSGYIYKKTYQSKYCVGCELNKTDSELENGRCPIHPNRDIELIDEENYFFKFSEFQKPLLAYYAAHPDFVIPNFRQNEIKLFVERGLEDFSISRLKSKMPWGVPVPGDDEHVMYVWFDALTSYISTLGWPDNDISFEKFWKQGTPVQYCGKDNLRQQSAMWQAMLMSVDLPNSSRIVINGFITSAGQKMSKSLGNVISPFEVIDTFKGFAKYPEDVLRFVLLHDIPSFEDGDITLDSIKLSYVNHLQNGIGNLTSRIMKMATTHLDGPVILPDMLPQTSIDGAIGRFDLKQALEGIMAGVRELDGYIQETEPFKVIKVDADVGKALITEMVERLASLAILLKPFLPNSADEIFRLVKLHQMPETPLFNRLS